MRKPSDEVLKAFASLEGNHAFQTVREWMEAELAIATGQLLTEKDPFAIGQLQGEARALSTVLEHADTAHDVLLHVHRKRQRQVAQPRTTHAIDSGW